MALKPTCGVFWFKRDLRLEDNEPLWAAARSGVPVLLVYLLEPSLVGDPHYGKRHWDFVRESLSFLQRALRPYKTRILCVESEALDFFRELNRHVHIHEVFSHMETGLDKTFRRDLEVADFFKSQGIPWREYRQGGVLRGLNHRRGWKEQWDTYMSQRIAPASFRDHHFVASDRMEGWSEQWPAMTLGTSSDPFQSGGSAKAGEVMESFFSKRLEGYQRGISKPLLSRESCSRLSPYIAWGNLSVRQVVQRAKEEEERGVWSRQLKAFSSRLQWHCHFIQKFESEPRMEFEALNRAFLNLSQPLNTEFLERWKQGFTGYPLVDAAMRCVRETGYLNFRLRAMVVSFLTHHLFQHFSHGSAWLAQQFLDFEPGIHYGQFQMQSGFTGTNTLRVYNPTKNAQEHDPEAHFIKAWVPELSGLPAPLAIEPWNILPMEAAFYGFSYGKDYPRRLVRIEATRSGALKLLYDLRNTGKGKEEAQRILARHTLPAPRNA